MQIGSIVAVFFVVWWICFVAVLPIGAHSHHETGETLVRGGDPGSPLAPRLVLKGLLATGLAAVLTALLLWALTNETLMAYWNR